MLGNVLACWGVITTKMWKYHETWPLEVHRFLPEMEEKVVQQEDPDPEPFKPLQTWTR